MSECTDKLCDGKGLETGQWSNYSQQLVKGDSGWTQLASSAALMVSLVTEITRWLRKLLDAYMCMHACWPIPAHYIQYPHTKTVLHCTILRVCAMLCCTMLFTTLYYDYIIILSYTYYFIVWHTKLCNAICTMLLYGMLAYALLCYGALYWAMHAMLFVCLFLRIQAYTVLGMRSHANQYAPCRLGG